MAAEISSLKKRKPPGFMTLLSSAVCEWFLILLLFVNAAVSYLLVQFANYCELKTPCLLCSRLDHVFGKRKPTCYWSLLCSNHREEVSSLVPCSIHDKLSDVNGMCEECFMPIAMQNKSNSESYRLLVGKLWVDIERSVLQNLMLNKHIRFSSSVRRTCSCCNKTWRTKSNAERLLGLTPVGLGASKANIKPPLPRVPGRSRFSRRDSLKRLREKFTGPMTHLSAASSTVDTLSHVGYTKLKISSDTESEVIFSEDDDDGNASSRDKNESKPEHDAQCGSRGLPKTQTEQTHQNFEVKPSVLDQPNLLDLSENKIVNFSSSDAFIEHGLRELNWAEYYCKPTQSLTSELISVDDGPQPLDVGGASSGVSAETSKSTVSLLHTSALSLLSELSLHDGNLLSNTVAISKKPIIDGGIGEKGNLSTAKHIEAVARTSSGDTQSNNINLTDASDKNIENRALSSTHAREEIKVSDSAENEGDTKSLAEVSTSEVGLSSKVSSPRAHDKHEELKLPENFSSRVFPVSASLERNESSHHESFDGISDGDIEGENILDRLKQQVEHDQICMNSLYRELEEERNAAATAANEAMAMITRLQEEKASLHMEALQYLRMMEEQAEYDMEALERANDLLSEKEKELQDLETELELYRNNLVSHTENSPDASSDSKSSNITKANGNCKPMNSSVSNFMDEKLYISQCLNDLEKKLHQAYCSRKIEDMPNGLDSDKLINEVGDLKDIPPNREISLSQEIEDNSSLVRNGVCASNGNHLAQDTAVKGIPDHDKESDFVSEKRGRLLANHGEINSSVFEKEISYLHERLKALETDRDFLKHVSNLLRNGNDGLSLIQEIAHQLQELRKVEFNKR